MFKCHVRIFYILRNEIYKQGKIYLLKFCKGKAYISKPYLHFRDQHFFFFFFERSRKRRTLLLYNSRNDVPQVARRYGTMAAYTRHRASVLIVFVMFCVHMYSFDGLKRRTPWPTFSNTAIINRHSDATISQLRAH